MVLALRPGVLGLNPVQISYFCHAFTHLFLCYGLCKMGARSELAVKLLNRSHTMTPFDALGNKPFENMWEKEKLLITFCHFRQI